MRTEKWRHDRRKTTAYFAKQHLSPLPSNFDQISAYVRNITSILWNLKMHWFLRCHPQTKLSVKKLICMTLCWRDDRSYKNIIAFLVATCTAQWQKKNPYTSVVTLSLPRTHIHTYPPTTTCLPMCSLTILHEFYTVNMYLFGGP